MPLSSSSRLSREHRFWLWAKPLSLSSPAPPRATARSKNAPTGPRPPSPGPAVRRCARPGGRAPRHRPRARRRGWRRSSRRPFFCSISSTRPAVDDGEVNLAVHRVAEDAGQLDAHVVRQHGADIQVAERLTVDIGPVGEAAPGQVRLLTTLGRRPRPDQRNSATRLSGSGKARLVGRAIDPDPVGLVDAPAVPAHRARWEGRRELDPSVLLPGDHPDLVRNLGQMHATVR